MRRPGPRVAFQNDKTNPVCSISRKLRIRWRHWGRILSFDFAEKRIDKGQDTTPMPYQLLRLEVGFVLDPPCPPIRLGFEFLAGDLNEGGLCFLAWRGIWIVQQFNQCGDHLSIAHAEFAAR